jgi:hypothetical protein
MQTKKVIFSMSLIVFVLLIILTYLPERSQAVLYPKFDVCIQNRTGRVVHYKGRWCTRDRSNCGNWVNSTLQPNYTMTHTSPRGMARLEVSYYTGGSKGWDENKYMEGETEGCRIEYEFKLDDKHYLHLYKIK